MTDTEILTKAIEKAVKNGYTAYAKNIKDVKEYEKEFIAIVAAQQIREHHPYEIIFSHSFAKAFWGEDNGSPCIHSTRKNDECRTGWHFDKDRPKSHGYYPAWQFHLQTMVLEENPISYIGRFL